MALFWGDAQAARWRADARALPSGLGSVIALDAGVTVFLRLDVLVEIIVPLARVFGQAASRDGELARRPLTGLADGLPPVGYPPTDPA